MNLEEIIGQARDAVGVRRIFGEPHKQSGVTVIPAAVIRGASGGGGGEGTVGAADAGVSEGDGRVGSGGGSGFALFGRPVGAFVIEDGEVSWRPAIDVTTIVLRGLLLGAVVYLVTRVLEVFRN